MTISDVMLALFKISVMPVIHVCNANGARGLTYLLFPGVDHFEEAMSYVEQHQLYEEALVIWKKTDLYQVITSRLDQLTR